MPYDLSSFGYDEVSHRFRPPPASDATEVLLYTSRSVSGTGKQLQSETLTPTTIPTNGTLQVSDRLFNDSVTVNENIGARLLQPLPGFGPLHSSLSFGPDFKRYRATSIQERIFQATLYVPEIGSSGPPFTSFKSPATVTSRDSFTSVDYFPLSLNWEGSVADKYGVTVFNVNNTYLFAGFLDSRAGLRAVTGSTNLSGNYYQGNYGISRDQKFRGDWGVRLHADGQFATERLISTEQFGFGGNAGVRGYRDGEVYTDTGWRVQIEPHTPSLNLGLVDAKTPLFVRLFGFMDYGQGYRLEKGEGQGRVDLWGTGFGFSGNISEHFDFRATLGVPLLNAGGVRSGQPRVTFGVGGQF
jgi:hypothetical protein